MPDEIPTPNVAVDAQKSGNDLALNILVLVGMAIGGVVFLLHLLAGGFPANTKTLARDAVLTGFVGGAVLIRELVRSLVSKFRSIVTVGFAVGGIVLVSALVEHVLRISEDSRAGRVVVSIAVALLWTSFLKFGGRLVSSAGKVFGVIPGGKNWGPKFLEIAPTFLGLALLVLSLFLQLRSIDLSKG